MMLNKDFSSVPNYFSIYFTPKAGDDYYGYGRTKSMLLDNNGKIISIYGATKFAEMDSYCERIIKYREESDPRYGSRSPKTEQKYYDVVTKKNIAIGNEIVESSRYFSYIGRYYGEEGETPRFYTFSKSWHEDELIYDSKVGLFCKNPYKNGNKSLFFKYVEGNALDGSDTDIYIDDWDKNEYQRQVHNENPEMSWSNIIDLSHKEEKKHIVPLLSINFEYVENLLPQNDEYEVYNKQQSTENRPAPAYSLTEGEIRNMVSTALKKILK
jgi:hypothetical protein